MLIPTIEKVDKVTVKTSLWVLFQNFGESTTLHGVRRTVARGGWRRVIWLLLLLSSIAWSLHQFVYILQDFYSYPITSVVSVKHETYIRFPAVTFCNLNKLRKSKISAELWREIEGLTMQYDLSNSNIQAAYNKIILRELGAQRVDVPGHNLEDMLIDCMFNGKRCTSKDFTYLGATVYGNCYSFNMEEDEPQYSSRAGSFYGLVLDLDIESHEYLPLTTTAGVKVTVHDPDEPPFPEDGGYVVSPGMATSIGIRKEETHRLPPPYGTCINEVHNKEGNLHFSWKYKYTENVCKKSCHQQTFYEMCGCCDFHLPCDEEAILNMAGKEVTENSHIYYCNNTKDVECVTSLELLFLNDELQCRKGCPPTCDETTYKTVISSGYWPADFHLDMFSNKINNTKLRGKTFESRDELNRFVRKNFLRLEIYYDSLDFTEILMKPLYDWSKVLGDIGGHLGLWLGFSILTGMELVELLLDTIVVCVRRFYSSVVLTRKVQITG